MQCTDAYFIPEHSNKIQDESETTRDNVVIVTIYTFRLAWVYANSKVSEIFYTFNSCKFFFFILYFISCE